MHNAKVYIAVRSKTKGDEAIQDLFAMTGKQAHLLQMDLASLKSTKDAAHKFMKSAYFIPEG
jgi:retinol dehydrogenase 12